MTNNILNSSVHTKGRRELILYTSTSEIKMTKKSNILCKLIGGHIKTALEN